MKIKIQKKFIAPIAILVLAFIYLIISLVSSGVLLTTKGIIYVVLNLILIGGLIFCGKKFHNAYMQDKKIKDIASDPTKLYDKLTENGNKFIDDGKEVNINLKEDKITGKKSLDVSLGKEVNQDWRKKYQKNPISKKEQKERPVKKKVAKKVAKKIAKS